MGVASHFVSSRDGEAESGNETKYRHIQETFVSNNDKVEEAMDRFEQYDMGGIFDMPNLVDKNGATPDDMYGKDFMNLVLHWDSMRYKDVLRWQKTINEWGSMEDRVSSVWALTFLKKSATQELRERVDATYKSLPQVHKGGVTYLYFMLKIMFYMSRDTIDALKTYLKLFQSKGLRKLRGENVVVAQKQLIAVCTRLQEVNSLPSETVNDILEGMSYCSVPEFAKVFEHYRITARAKISSIDDDDDDDDTLAEIKKFLVKAVDEYHALNTAGKWNVPHSTPHAGAARTGVDCWNCGANGHASHECRKPKNHENIAANRKKWQETRDKQNQGSEGGRPPIQQQQRKKWGTEQPSGEVKWEGGTPKAHCNRCGWNDSHSTKYHSAYSKNPASFNICTASPKHPLTLAKFGSGTPMSPKTQEVSPDHVLVSKAHAESVLTNLERTSASDDTVEMVGALRTLFSLN